MNYMNFIPGKYFYAMRRVIFYWIPALDRFRNSTGNYLFEIRQLIAV